MRPFVSDSVLAVVSLTVESVPDCRPTACENVCHWLCQCFSSTTPTSGESTQLAEPAAHVTDAMALYGVLTEREMTSRQRPH